MKSIEYINRLLNLGNGVLLTSDAEKAGISRMQLSRMVKNGILVRSERGVYVKDYEIGDELYSIQKRAKKIIYSHETALFLHRLTDRTPFRYSITVPSGYKPSQHIKNKCKVYYIKQNLMDLGKIELPSGFGHLVISYDTERTICDVLRSRNKIDNQIFVDALKNYFTNKNMNLNRLENYAQQFNVFELLRQYLEVLL